MTNLERWVLAFGITDEIFAVAIQQKQEVNAKYLSGLVITPYVGWALGTLLGATATGLLPDSLRNALGIAIYGMFIAIIIPPACKAKPIEIPPAVFGVHLPSRGEAFFVISLFSPKILFFQGRTCII